MFRSRLADAAVVGCLTAAACFCALCARADEPYAIVAQSSRSSATTGRRPLVDRIASANLPIISDAEVRPDGAPETRAESRIPVERQVATGRAAGTRPASGQPQKPAQGPAVTRRAETGPAAENMAVAAVPVEHLEQHAQQMPAEKPAATSNVWPFAGKWPTMPWTGSPKATAGQGSAAGNAATQTAHATRTTGKGSTPAQPQPTVAMRKTSGPSEARPSTPGAAAARQTGSGGGAQRTARSSGNGLSNSSPSSVTR